MRKKIWTQFSFCCLNLTCIYIAIFPQPNTILLIKSGNFISFFNNYKMQCNHCPHYFHKLKRISSFFSPDNCVVTSLLFWRKKIVVYGRQFSAHPVYLWWSHPDLSARIWMGFSPSPRNSGEHYSQAWPSSIFHFLVNSGGSQGFIPKAVHGESSL